MESPVALHLINTLTRKKELFVPRDEGKVGIYLCGPTVYNEPHVGNLRNIVVMDVLRRELVAKLFDAGLAYQSGGDVDFSVGKFPEYGKLSGRDLAGEQAGARVEVNPDKRDPLDFVLWKAAKPGEPTWNSAWASTSTAAART